MTIRYGLWEQVPEKAILRRCPCFTGTRTTAGRVLAFFYKIGIHGLRNKNSEYRQDRRIRGRSQLRDYLSALLLFWCWFPQNQELVVFEKNGTNLRRILTGLPDRSATSDLIRIDTLGFVEPGLVVCLATSRVPARRAVDALLYRLDVIPRSWQRIQHPGIENSKSEISRR